MKITSDELNHRLVTAKEWMSLKIGLYFPNWKSKIKENINKNNNEQNN